MPTPTRLVFELLVVNGRVMRIVHCPCGDGVVVHAGERIARCHCGKALEGASSLAE